MSLRVMGPSRRAGRAYGWWLLVMVVAAGSAGALSGCDEGDDPGNIGGGAGDDMGPLDPGDEDEGPGMMGDRGIDSGPGDGADMAGASPDAAPGPVEVEPCISTVVVGGVEIFAYEASRADAAADSAGFDESAGICSRPGVLPWTGLTWPDANRTCMAHGFRLCSNEEWQTACQGPDRLWGFPYGMGHRAAVCNDHVSGSGAVEVTGGRPECRTPEGLYDMSGNVWELTTDAARRGASWKLNASNFRVDAARCDMFYDIVEGFADDDVGFRCCR